MERLGFTTMAIPSYAEWQLWDTDDNEERRCLLQPVSTDAGARPGLHRRLEGFCQCPLTLGGPAHNNNSAAAPALGRRPDDTHTYIDITHTQDSTEEHCMPCRYPLVRKGTSRGQSVGARDEPAMADYLQEALTSP